MKFHWSYKSMSGCCCFLFSLIVGFESHSICLFNKNVYTMHANLNTYEMTYSLPHSITNISYLLCWYNWSILIFLMNYRFCVCTHRVQLKRFFYPYLPHSVGFYLALSMKKHVKIEKDMKSNGIRANNKKKYTNIERQKWKEKDELDLYIFVKMLEYSK